MRSQNPKFLAWWQLRIFGLRVHHGAAGVGLVAGAYLPRRLVTRLLALAVGAFLIWDDWDDRPWLP